MKLVYYDMNRKRTVVAESDNAEELINAYIDHRKSHFIYSPTMVKIPPALPKGSIYSLNRDDIAGYEYAVEN